jgi:hypothetical protein
MPNRSSLSFGRTAWPHGCPSITLPLPPVSGCIVPEVNFSNPEPPKMYFTDFGSFLRKKRKFLRKLCFLLVVTNVKYLPIYIFCTSGTSWSRPRYKIVTFESPQFCQIMEHTHVLSPHKKIELCHVPTQQWPQPAASPRPVGFLRVWSWLSSDLSPPSCG